MHLDVRFPRHAVFERGFARLREEFQIAEAFSPEVEAEAKRVADRAASTAGDVKRRDHRDLAFVTIDPEGAQDLDQAFTAERTATGYRVFYAIADVGHFVEPDGLLDEVARARGVTFYAPDRKASLHPEPISHAAGSLLPGEDRPALVWTLDLSEDGALDRAHVERGVVRSRAARSYADVDADLASHAPEDVHTLLAEIGQLRQQREISRGGVSLRLPSQEVEPEGQGYTLRFRQVLPVERWNAQISLLTGIAAARIMLAGGCGLLRTLPTADDDTVRYLRRHSRALGVDYPDAATYPEWVRSLDPSMPTHAALMTQAARAFRGAAYLGFRGNAPEAHQHGAIASAYAHVTAPLRRLIDRFGNEIVLAEAAGEDPPAWALDALDVVPELMMEASRRERAFERAVVDFAEAVVLAPRVGERFDAVVTHVDRDRATLQIRDPAIVARARGIGAALGDEVSVRLVDADPEARKLRFERA